MKVTKTKKRKMEVEEVKENQIDVTVLVNKWMESQKNICEVLLTLVNKINALENKLV